MNAIDYGSDLCNKLIVEPQINALIPATSKGAKGKA
jgi:hypothetical protein